MRTRYPAATVFLVTVLGLACGAEPEGDPDDMSPYGLCIDGDTVISGFNEDELGIVQVKTYRLERPDGGT